MPGPTPRATGAAAAFRVRPARRGDAEAIRGLIGELGYPNVTDSGTVNWIISHPEIELLVAADAMDKAIGVLTLSHRPQLHLKGRIATIDELVVTAAWRRKGVGRELLRKGIERAKVLSVQRLELVSHPGQAEVAQKFCIACGFVLGDAVVLKLPNVSA